MEKHTVHTVYVHSSVNILLPEPPGGDALRHTWKRAQSSIDSFWKAWSQEYVLSLQTRPKWVKMEKDLQIGELVLLIDELKKRDDWTPGIVEEVGGSGCHVQKAVVHMANGKKFELNQTKRVRLEHENEKLESDSRKAEGT